MFKTEIPKDDTGAKVTILRAESPAAIVRDSENVKAIRSHMGHFGYSFYGGESSDAAIRKTIEGDNALVERARTMLDKFSLTAHTIRTRNVADIVGGCAIVPAVLAGHPLSMLHRKRVREESAPLNVYVSLTSSGGINANELLTRGVAVLALTMKLVETRPVNLFVFSELGQGRSHDVYLIAPINTRPLDLASSAYILSSAGFSRGVCYSVQQAHGAGGNWPSRREKAGYTAFLRNLFNMGPDDLLIESAHIDSFRNPEEWLKQQLAKYQPAEY